MAPSNYIEAETATINKNTKISSYTILPTDDDEETTTDNGSEEENHRILTPSSILSDVSSDDIKVVVPPDGGWGWMIVFASFMCNVIVDGIICSYGMFLESIVDEFKVSSISAALVGSLMSGFYLIVGPFASAIANKFGFRLVAIIGSILGAFALAISSFSTSVEFLYISYGLIGGIGFGFIYVPAVITVGFYFEKWRALATGIGVSQAAQCRLRDVIFWSKNVVEDVGKDVIRTSQ